ncbi:MAG: beta-N-acetylhexosaminidase, partial [Pseudomonadota bacterium]
MNFKQRIGQRLVIGIRGTSLDEATRSHLKEISPGGVILFSRNISHPDQVRNLIRDIKETVQPSPLIAVDQEGGLVVRFFRDVTIMPGNMALGAIDSPDLAYKQGVLMARELKAIGFDLNLAPVVDVVTTYDNPGITIRSFGSDSPKVATLAVNFVQGTQSSGMGAVAKHFPGKGAASKDAHFDLPKVDIPWNEMLSTHLLPFQECIKNGIKGVMSSHVIYPNIPGCEKFPATFSSRLTRQYLREKLNFKGVIFSDDLEMGAITKFFPFEEAVVKALKAGHDMVLICSDYEKQRLTLQVLRKAYEVDSVILKEMDESVERIDRLRNFCQRNNPPPFSKGGLGGFSAKNHALNLAQEIAERAITLREGSVPVPIPLKPGIKIFTIIPELSQLESIEDGFEKGEHNFISQALEATFSMKVQKQFIPLDSEEEVIEKALENAKNADIVLAFIFNARTIKGQRLLLEKLKAFPRKVIWILL